MTDFGESMLQGNGADPSMHELLLAATGKSGSSKPRAAIADGAQDEEEQAAATEKEDEEDEEEGAQINTPRKAKGTSKGNNLHRTRSGATNLL